MINKNQQASGDNMKPKFFLFAGLFVLTIMTGCASQYHNPPIEGDYPSGGRNYNRPYSDEYNWVRQEVSNAISQRETKRVLPRIVQMETMKQIMRDVREVRGSCINQRGKITVIFFDNRDPNSDPDCQSKKRKRK